MKFTREPEIKFTKLFINNEWVDALSKKFIDVENPATQNKICSVHAANADDIDLAVKAACHAFEFTSPWRTMDATQRAKIINNMADIFEKEIEYIASLESVDNGKKPEEAAGDVKFSISLMRYYAGYSDKISGKVIPCDGPVFSFTRLEPVGVVGAITPWNYPFQMAICKISGALAAGCTIVFKPAEQTPLTALYIGDVAKRAGLPAGVLNIVPGFGEVAGAALTSHKNVDKVSFTGSTEVGRLILQASGTSNLKRVSLELGGKSALIICNDCPDLYLAAYQAFHCAIANHGQCCVAATRTYVQSEIYDEFLKITKKMAEELVVGDPFDEATQQGPQIDQIQSDKILDLIESGKKEGAKLLYGGQRLERKGYFFQPTVFADATDNMRIAREEIFGPVQTIFKFETIDEAIKRANDSDYGLGAGVFTKDIQTALYTSQRLKAGSVWINTYLQLGPQTAFGGFKQSGHGREMGESGIRIYLEEKTVVAALDNKIS